MPLVLPFGSGGESAQDELLDKVGGHALSGVDTDIRKDQPNATIRCWIVGIGGGSRDQIATDGGIVRLRRPLSPLQMNGLANAWRARDFLVPCPGSSSVGLDGAAMAGWRRRSRI